VKTAESESNTRILIKTINRVFFLLSWLRELQLRVAEGVRWVRIVG